MSIAGQIHQRQGSTKLKAEQVPSPRDQSRQVRSLRPNKRKTLLTSELHTEMPESL